MEDDRETVIKNRVCGNYDGVHGHNDCSFRIPEYERPYDNGNPNRP